jgi:hypothetical protein
MMCCWSGALLLILVLLGLCGIPFSYVFSFAFQTAASGSVIGLSEIVLYCENIICVLSVIMPELLIIT